MLLNVDDNHHVGRHLSQRHIDDGVLGRAAFVLGGHEYVSVYHLEYFAASVTDEQLSCVCAHLNDSHKLELEGGRRIRASNQFAILNVGSAKAAMTGPAAGIALKVEKRAEAGAPFHAGLFGYRDDEIGYEVADALCNVAQVSPKLSDLPSAATCNCNTR